MKEMYETGKKYITKGMVYGLMLTQLAVVGCGGGSSGSNPLANNTSYTVENPITGLGKKGGFDNPVDTTINTGRTNNATSSIDLVIKQL